MISDKDLNEVRSLLAKAIELLEEKSEYLSKYFKPSEMACNHCGQMKASPELMKVLDDVREHFGKPVTITSGYRCVVHNKNVGGATASKHLEGIAADIKVKDVLPSDVHKYLTSKYSGKYGIGKYNTFTHIDVRPDMARWG